MIASAESTVVLREIGAHESCQWDEFVGNAENGNLLQSWGWGEFKRRHGWQPVRLALVRDGRIEAGAQVLLRSLVGVSVAYVPRGPVVPAGRPDLYKLLLTAVHRLARSRHSIFLKIEPNEPWSVELAVLLRGLGFVRSPHTVQPRATLMLDLDGGSDAVLARLHSKTRYRIRLAGKHGVRVRPAEDDVDIERFHHLMVETGGRAGFTTRSLGYYRAVLREFEKRDQARLLLAEFEGRVIAGVMVFAFGREGIYMYGASSDEHKREMPNYLLQWEAIQWCVERGCSRYDLWGVPEQAAAKFHDEQEALAKKRERGGLWGVYRFKQRFADRPVLYTGAYDYPYLRPLYLLWAHVRKNKEM